MGNTGSNSSKNINLAKKYGIKPEQIKIIDGKMFLNQERNEVKLSTSVLKSFMRNNNFSRDYDEDPKK